MVYLTYVHTDRQCMHEVFHSFPPTSPSRVTTWWGTTSCSEWWGWLTHDSTSHCALKLCRTFTYASSFKEEQPYAYMYTPHPILYMCTGHKYVPTTIMYVAHWYILAACSHNCMWGNGTSAYNMHNTVYCKCILYIYVYRLCSWSIVYNFISMYIAIASCLTVGLLWVNYSVHEGRV